MQKTVLIVGAGHGLSASIARLFAQEGMRVALAARTPDKIEKLANEIEGLTIICDCSDPDQVSAMFTQIQQEWGQLDILVFNAGARTGGAITDIDRDVVKEVLISNAYGGFLVAQEAARMMVECGQGTMLFTGASASIKGYAKSAPFAMGKFALRGLCQSLARELAPQNIHVAHVIIDGLIYSQQRGGPFQEADKTLHPDEIAKNYLNIARQERNAWTWEIELRPWNEAF